tara:strand:+ start:62 stop:937 length:876 start_codon:yes stop_codon:yes gene_type:complete
MKTEYLKQAYYSPSKETFDALIKYLEELGGRKFKEAQISNCITKTKWQDKESKIIFRVHIQTIVEYLKAIEYDFVKDEKLVQSIIADITEVFKTYENSSVEDIDWIILSTNVLPSFIHHKQVKGLFRDKNIGCSVEKNNNYDLLAIFGARLALEKRVFSLLKIDYALIADTPIGLSKMLEVIETLDSIEFDDKLDWKLIMKINKWLNYYIHRQLRPWPWTIHKIFKFLDIILSSGVVEKGERKIYSFYYSTVVIDEQKLDEELESKMKEKFGDVKIKWSHIREAVKIKKSD